jgi:tetratricopeptide (TPR) repeat protein
MAGELDEADRLMETALRFGERAGEPDTVVVYLGQVCLLRVEQGRADEIVGMLELAASENPGIPAFEAGLAATLCDIGRAEEVAPRLERAAAHRFADVPLDQVHSTALAAWARAAADIGSERAAAPLYDLIEPWRGQMVWNGTTGYGAAEMYLGMLAATLGSHERANEHFAVASELHGRERVPGWEARNLCYWARSLHAEGAADRAHEAADRALAVAREHGFGSSARHAEALLRVGAGR